MKRYRVAIGAKSYHVEVGDPQELPLTVIVDGETFSVDMQPVEKADHSVLVAMAVYIGKTRLIDNFSYEV